MQAVPQCIEADSIDYFAQEGEHQQHAGFFQGDAALLHVEQSRVVQLAYGGSVAALHVVGIDFKLRLCVHPGVAGGAKVAVGLLRRGMLGPRSHQD